MKRNLEDIHFEKHFNSINQKLNLLLQERNNQKKTWVGSSVITEMTGWDFEGMRKARRNNIIQTRGEGKKIQYLLESLPEVFIKNTILGNNQSK